MQNMVYYSKIMYRMLINYRLLDHSAIASSQPTLFALCVSWLLLSSPLLNCNNRYFVLAFYCASTPIMLGFSGGSRAQEIAPSSEGFDRVAWPI